MFPGRHHAEASLVGEVAGFPLGNAYGLATTGSRLCAQWWRPVPGLDGLFPAPFGAGPGGVTTDAQVYTWTGYVPPHWDLLRVHVVWALISTYDLEVTHRILVDSLPGGEEQRPVDGEDGDWGVDALVLDGWPRLYETEVAGEIPSPGGDVSLDVRLSLSADTGLGLALYWQVAFTVFGEVW
ncbi:MAG: hypothetical protein AAF627_19450 [Myxococcota bacterium]